MPARSFLFASMPGPGQMLVTVHELAATDSSRTLDRLYLYNAGVPELRPLLPGSVPQGAGVLSPDGTRAAFCAVKRRRPAETSLWVLDLGTGQSTELVSEDGVFVASPVWRSSRNITFLRAARTAHGILTEVVQVPVDGEDTPDKILPSEAGVVAITYSPDGSQMAFWAKSGLEVLTLATGERKGLFKWNQAAYRFQSLGIGGLAWSTDRKIAFALVNDKTRKSELWVIGQDGSNPKSIYSTKDADIIVSQFVP